MSSVRLEPARLVADGDALYGIAATLSSAVRSCERALGSTGGMAGDDESAEVYAHGQDGEPGYDQYAVDVLNGKLGAAESAWSELAGALSRVQGQVDSAFTSVSAATLPQQGTMLSCQRSLSNSLGKVGETASSKAGFAQSM